MRTVIILLALAGALVSALALQGVSAGVENFFTVTDDWDCGVVSRSSYAKIGPLPVAGIGIVGYLSLVWLATVSARDKLALGASLGFAVSLYLSHIQRDVLRVWCQYCVISQVVMLALLLLCAVWWWAGRHNPLTGTES